MQTQSRRRLGRSVLPVVAVLAAWLLASCASPGASTVRYDGSRDRSTYSSARALLGSPGMSGGLSSNQRIMWQATGSCEGEACKPQSVDVIFFNGGTGELNLDSRGVEIIFDGTSRSWEDPGRSEEPAYYSVPRGEFARIQVTGAEFARLASAARVDVIFGTTGTTPIRAPYERREAFRELATAMGY